MSFTFTLNGEPVRIEGLAPATTLLDWLRAHNRTGSKQGCAEGDCGACTVALVENDVHGHTAYRAINSCIALLPMFAGREIVTVEGLAHGGKLHPVQSSMVEHYGSQCGHCTPGFVMSLFDGCYRMDCRTSAAAGAGDCRGDESKQFSHRISHLAARRLCCRAGSGPADIRG